MQNVKKKQKEAVDRPTPFIIYLISVLIAFTILMPATISFFYLLDLDFFAVQSHEMVVISAMLLGGGLTIVAGGAFGFFANRQITDIKE